MITLILCRYLIDRFSIRFNTVTEVDQIVSTLLAIVVYRFVAYYFVEFWYPNHFYNFPNTYAVVPKYNINISII